MKKDTIKERYYELLKKNKNRILFNKVPLTILNPFPEHINVSSIIKKIEEYVSYHFIKNVDEVFVSNSKTFRKRNIDAMYKDGAIYIYNQEDNPDITEERIARDFIHELAHSLESVESLTIYGDQTLADEFLSKRSKLFQMIELDLDDETLPEEIKDRIFELEYSLEMDKFLHNEVGYDNLSLYVINLFTSPYSSTSLAEYFSNGFEDYFCGDRFYLQEICPVLFEKIEQLTREMVE